MKLNINKKKIMKLIKRIEIFFVLIIISILFSLPLIQGRKFETHDGAYHVSRIIGTIFSLNEGQFFPLIISEWTNGFGYSWNLFYPFLLILVGVVLKTFCATYTDTLYLLILLLTFLASFSMYFLMKNCTKNKKIAIITSVIYISAPYRLTDIFVRMSLGEIITFSFLPILFLGMYNLFYGNKKMIF